LTGTTVLSRLTFCGGFGYAIQAKTSTTDILSIKGSFTAISGNDLNTGIKVYPNPATNYITIETDQPAQSFSIVNAEGLELVSQEVVEKTSVIDISKFPAGYYVVRVTSADNKVTVSSFVK